MMFLCVMCTSLHKTIGPMFFEEAINFGCYSQLILAQFFRELCEERIDSYLMQDSTMDHREYF